ncbi:hypothetical protein E4U43_006767, partial [Claviceps pusilla]
RNLGRMLPLSRWLQSSRPHAQPRRHPLRHRLRQHSQEPHARHGPPSHRHGLVLPRRAAPVPQRRCAGLPPRVARLPGLLCRHSGGHDLRLCRLEHRQARRQWPRRQSRGVGVRHLAGSGGGGADSGGCGHRLCYLLLRAEEQELVKFGPAKGAVERGCCCGRETGTFLV